MGRDRRSVVLYLIENLIHFRMPARITDLKFPAVRGLDASEASRGVKNLNYALWADRSGSDEVRLLERGVSVTILACLRWVS